MKRIKCENGLIYFWEKASQKWTIVRLPWADHIAEANGRVYAETFAKVYDNKEMIIDHKDVIQT